MYCPTYALTVDNAQTVLSAGLRAISEGQTQFDLVDITAVDSAAVATLLAWQRAAVARGTPLAFSNVPGSLRSLIELYGVTELLHPSPATRPHADSPHH